MAHRVVDSRVYLDHASESPLLAEAKQELTRWLDVVGDPARPFAEGLRLRRAIEEAREIVASFVGATPRGVVFCSSGTEGLNWLVRAAVESCDAIVTTKVEHSAVNVTLGRLASHAGVDVWEVPADRFGFVSPETFEAVLKEAVQKAYGGRPSRVAIFCFVQHANHETGTLQPTPEISEVARSYGARVVCDACQTVGRIPVDIEELGVAALVISGHKFGGPKGAAAVVLRPGIRPHPLLMGTAQERGRRAGPEDVPAIRGFAAACQRVAEDLDSEAEREARLVASLRNALLSRIPGIESIGHPTSRVPHIAAFQLPDIQGEAMVLALDKRGFAVHSGSACAAEGFEPSPILEAIGYDSRLNLRVSVGRTTSAEDISAFIEAFVEEARSLASLGASLTRAADFAEVNTEQDKGASRR